MFSAKDVRDFIRKNRSILDRENHYLGGWVDNGEVFLDVSVIGKPDESTLARAEESRQEAVFDLKTGKTIQTKFGKPKEGGG